jgi:6-pyruvoyltetrahydropterin/6-carboxytetrahydropterin synthase
MESFDHRFLNKEVPEFASQIPTTENIAVAVWNRLGPRLGNGARLHRVRVYEAADLFADYYGEA